MLSGLGVVAMIALLVTSPLHVHSQLEDLLRENAKIWSSKLYENLQELREFTAAEQLRKMYQNPAFQVQEVTDSYSQQLLNDALEKVVSNLRKKENILQHLRESVEEEFVNYVPPDTEECYIRSKAVNLFPPVTAENDTRPVLCNESQYMPLASDPLFHDLYVSVNTSTAHVPTNVYDLSSEIRTVANWTRNLDEVFRFNLEQDPSLKWQYFCSSTGFFKFFPGAMWKVQLADLKLDFFDCRSTLWYVGAASYPMEMVIIIDKSGSMKGRRNTISNATLVELLNTLTENDFFNVIYDKFYVLGGLLFLRTYGRLINGCALLTHVLVLPGQHACSPSRLLGFFTIKAEFSYQGVFLNGIKQMLMTSHHLELVKHFMGQLIMQFSEIIKYAEPTIQDRLIQATEPNKDRIIRSFANHAPNGTANFQAAWTAAFSLLNIRNETRISQCNRVIMLITDGAPEEFTELFEKFNPEKNVRVFVYLLGQHSADETIVQRIACQNRGLSSSVANLADVKENILKYLDIVARSNAIQNDSFNSWNGISEQQLSIMDLNPSNFTRPQPSNLTIVDNGTLKEVPLEEIQMDAQSSVPLIQSVSDSVHPKPKDFYLSVSTAVYDRTINTTKEHKGILLGVVGVDVPIEDVRNVLRGWKTGPLSHFFCTNNNGFVQFHPHYRPMHGSQLKRYYDNVDIDEIEQPLDFVLDTNTALPFYNSTLRTMLIDRQNDSVLLEALENPEDFLWALPMEKKIFTAALAGTPFSCGVSMRWYRNTTRGYPIPKFDTNSIRRHWNIRGSSMKVLNPQLTKPAESCEVDTALPYGALLSPVKFCKFGRDLLHLFSSDPICALKQVLIDSKSRKENNCDEQHIAEIFVDAQATSSIYNHWKNLEGHSLVNMFGIQQVFSIHQPGLIRFYNYTQPTYANFLSEHEAGVEDSLYSSTVLRSSFYENYKMLVFSPPPRQVFRWFLEKDLPVPMTVTTVVSHPAAESVPLAVSGAQLTYQKVTELFHSIVNSCRGSGCLRCNDTGVHCYITTENGQIIVSTQGEKAVNQNLKELDCALMEALVGANIMQEREFYDFQAICIEAVIPEVNFASRIFSPLNRIAQFLWHFFTEFLLLWAKTAFFHLQSSAVAQASIWRDLPQISGGLDDYSTLHPEEKQNPENAPYAYGSQSRDESDFNFANQLRQDRVDGDPMLPPAFYGDYEVLKLTDTPQEPRFMQENSKLPTKTKEESKNLKGRQSSVPKDTQPAISTPLGEAASASNRANDFVFPFGSGGLGGGYNYEEPDDPWLMQQQAFSELNACYMNEPTLVLGKPAASQSVGQPMPSASTDAEGTTVDVGTVFPEKEEIQLRGVPGLNNTPVNDTKTEKTVSKPPVVPGALLRCIQRVVQMRCHAAGHSSNIIGRQACEVMCEAVRQRMSHFIEFLHDCRQPLDSCTQRYSVFFLNREAYAAGQVAESKHGSKNYGKKYPKKTERGKSLGREALQLHSKIHSGTYCLACGNADWIVSSIPDTNLLLVVTAMARESAAVNCNCGCVRRYRYGTRLKGGEAFPRPQTHRAEPPSPATCQMVSYKVENASLCASAASQLSSGLLLGRLSGLFTFLALFHKGL